MTVIMLLCLLADVPSASCVASAEHRIVEATIHWGESRAGSARWYAVEDSLLQPPIRTGALSLPVGGGRRSSGATTSSGGGDSLWNGILIGAALGVVAIYTTAAEAPPSGKITTVVMTAALGGYVDSRLAVTSPVGPGWAGRGRRLLLLKSVRF